MQAAAFVAGLRRAHDQLGHLHQVAQFQQVARDVEVRVELLDLGLQQRDAVARALQPLVGAHDAHVVPHEAAQLVPVVRDDHRLVGVGDAAVVPGGQRGRGAAQGASAMAVARRARTPCTSTSELLARRLAPCRPVQAVSPMAYRPGMSVRPARSVSTPPQV
jgi:hypothetical protein